MPPLPRIYLRPLGLITGPAAGDALAGGWALPLGGPDCAFTACEIFHRQASLYGRLLVPASALRCWSKAQPDDVVQAFERTLARLVEPPPLPPGLPREFPLIMGVVNVTPDSFSDGGDFFDAGAAVAHGRRLWEAGAAIVDVGGESTRPGAAPVPAEEEIRRTEPVVRALAQAGIRVSIDTRKAAVMRAALDAGAALINDVSALRHDPESLAVAAASGVPVVLMHSQGDPSTMQRDPRYVRAPLDIYDYLEDRIAACASAGITREHLIIDPGIGFGKTVAHNIDILHHSFLYRGLGAALLIGASRKSFIARIMGEVPVTERLPGSLAAALFALVNGAFILRVHDVAETRQAIHVWRALSNLTQTG